MSDLISRQMALNALKRDQSYFSPEDGPLVYYEYRHAINAIKNLPSIEPARMKGKWIIHRIEYRLGWFDECSECGYLTPEYEGYKGYHAWNFCPRCGAFMRGSDN